MEEKSLKLRYYGPEKLLTNILSFYVIELSTPVLVRFFLIILLSLIENHSLPCYELWLISYRRLNVREILYF